MHPEAAVIDLAREAVVAYFDPENASAGLTLQGIMERLRDALKQ